MVITKEYLEQQEYIAVRQCENGVWIGVSVQIYTFGLCVGLGEFEYKNRYCYEHLGECLKACRLYEGEGDPSGPWIKRKGEDGEKLGPGAKGVE
jgi:hypothetical protein